MTLEQFKEFVTYRLESYSNDKSDYEAFCDDFGAFLINNPPREIER